MSYKSLGRTIVPSCTPAPMTMYDTRSCRERTNCTRECIPKKLTCDWCGEKTSYLNDLENSETKEHISICFECYNKINKEDIDR